MPAAPSRRADRLFAVTLAYTLIAVVMTWPLARHLGSRLAADVGDPAFNSWVLEWTAGQILAALSGNVGALASYWHGNIFTPEPLTLAYSEHLTAQALQVLPIYAATGNILAAYNTLFIATFAISGIAMYLLVRDLTHEPAAAFVAGLAFAYAPYRLGQFSHVQVLSSYWMPLVLLGLHRFFVRSTPQAGTTPADTAADRPRSRTRPLAGASAALVLQNLSCGYYMLFFTPFVAAYVAYEMVQRRLMATWRTWGSLALAAAAVALLTWPFVQPYFAVREQTGLGVRSREEIQLFSADAHAFATIAPNSRWLAERLSGFPKAEGEGFPGFTILGLAIVGLGCGLTRIVRGIPWRTLPEWHVLGLGTAIVLFSGSAVVLLWYFVHGRLDLTAFGGSVIYQNASQPLTIAVASFVAFAGLTTAARRLTSVPSQQAFGFFAIAACAAALLALGPRMHALGRDLGPGLYQWVIDFLPGYDGLRVPARFLMLVALFLAALAGLGAATLLATRYRRTAMIALGVAATGILAEAWVAPMQMDQPVIPPAEFTVPPRPAAGDRRNPLYHQIKTLPDPVVLAELPFGEPAYDVLAVFYAGYHRRPLLNGYSGFFPRSYRERARVLQALPANGERAAAVLRDAQATHVLVHEAAYASDRGKKISEWLLSIGARQVATHGQDRLFALR